MDNFATTHLIKERGKYSAERTLHLPGSFSRFLGCPRILPFFTYFRQCSLLKPFLPLHGGMGLSTPQPHLQHHTHTTHPCIHLSVSYPSPQQHHNQVSTGPSITMETSFCKYYRQIQPLWWLVPVNPHVSVCA